MSMTTDDEAGTDTHAAPRRTMKGPSPPLCYGLVALAAEWLSQSAITHPTPGKVCPHMSVIPRRLTFAGTTPVTLSLPTSDWTSRLLTILLPSRRPPSLPPSKDDQTCAFPIIMINLPFWMVCRDARVGRKRRGIVSDEA
jgi:hypothetical protein